MFCLDVCTNPLQGAVGSIFGLKRFQFYCPSGVKDRFLKYLGVILRVSLIFWGPDVG